MYEFLIQNEYNEKLELSSMIEEYSIISIAGIDPPNAQIYEVKNAGMDGNVFNEATLEDRLIIVTFAINGPAEDNRLNLYRYLKIKKKHRLFYKNGQRDVYIDGYLESLPIGIFEQKEIAQATFRCVDPYFKNISSISEGFSNTKKLFEFPFNIEVDNPIPFSEYSADSMITIINLGDVITGGIFTIQALGTVVNPRISSVNTGEYFEFDLTMTEGQVLTVNTIEKQKSVTLNDDGYITNAISHFTAGSDFIQITPGINDFYISASSGVENVVGEISINTLYEGA